MLLAIDSDDNFINVESVAVASVLSFQTAGINCSELDAPKRDGFSAHGDTPFGEWIFDISMAQVEAIVEPNGVSP